MFSFIYNLYKRVNKRINKESGMTLVEVVIAFFIIAIISTVLVRGTITAVNTVGINKSKTTALAIANEKLEILKSFDYEDILISEGNEAWTDYYPELSDDTYDISYSITWANGEANSYKQLKVSVSGEDLKVPVEVVTQIYPPTGEEATGGNIYPPPESLKIDSDTGENATREISLSWLSPETERTIIRYNIYRDGSAIGSALSEYYYQDTPGDDDDHTYSVTALYEGEIESVHSNSISTGMPLEYPPPQNLVITGYSGEEDGRTVHLQWEPPVTELVILEYMIYRDDIDIYLGSVVSTQDLIFDYIIGTDNYTFYVTALYELGSESGPSNLQTTQ
jgi:type II secretory pathway pseudopilin PulG